LLVGPRYAPLRREFWPWSQHRRTYPTNCRRALVLLGGSAVVGVRQVISDVIVPLTMLGLEIELVGGLESGGQEMEREDRNLRMHQVLPDLAKQMAECDLAIAAAGTTVWELAFMRTPSLLLSLADNQLPVAASLSAAGAAVDLGWHGDLTAESVGEAVRLLAGSPSQRAELGERAGSLVDAEGGRRAVLAMRGDVLRLRSATLDDEALYWRWVNDPGVRQSSFSDGPIAAEEHRDWFRSKVTSDQTLLFVALDAHDRPIGQIRFEDVDQREAIVGVSISSEFRGLGLASVLIREGTRRMLRLRRPEVVQAYIRDDNRASRQAFAKAGFEETERVLVRGIPSVLAVYSHTDA
jgi:UDP-2,4-diacetamido-2,4,6-trideoxy-beta-L-altropyranose hydrolase